MSRTIRGAVLAFEDGRVVGWAFDPDNASRPVELDVCVNDTVVMQTRANMHALPLAERGIGSGNHAFSIKLPERYTKNDIKNSLRVRTSDGSILLPFIPDWDASLKNPPLAEHSTPEESQNITYLHNTMVAGSPARMVTANLDQATQQPQAVAAEDEESASPSPAIAESDIRLIAFYLPQFHPIPENDEWWGKGFTEWTNVSKAKPLYEGHYQPHMPGDLGFYDLRVDEIREEQARLAKRYGIHGFCYYYYWFNGRRILEKPLQAMLDSGKPDFPFCICWANENWTRTWDGADSEILLAQTHSKESDEAFINDVIPILKDKRYIRINGAPLLVVYRSEILPHTAETLRTWRKICKENGIEKLHLCMAQTFGNEDPRKYGFDSALQFPPHGIHAAEINQEIPSLPANYTGKIYRYDDVVENELVRRAPDYTWFRGVMPSWDNTPRKGLAGNVFHGATPEKFRRWLGGAIEYTRENLPKEERLVFINAWNEWAEGAHLEPDQEHGHSYLQAAQKCLQVEEDWRDILAALNTDRKISKSRRQKLLQGLENTLEAQERSLTYYQHLFKRFEGGGFFRKTHNVNHFVDVMPNYLRSIPHIFGGILNIERIQHHDFLESRHAVISARHPLHFVGWTLAYGKKQSSENTPFLLVLQETDNEQPRKYYCPIATRKQRQDVVESFKDMGSEYTLYSGFEDFIDLSRAKPGVYSLGAIHIQGHAAMTCFADGRITITE
ncbi:MAG: glycoside hydrolase family 99-like domain-containing protein [Rickettsiales bacterium]|nr:glycoside hydrolase family 99-like domain-containing protein [Rickettsiales bacterium]